MTADKLNLFTQISQKGGLKLDVYDLAFNVFQEFKTQVKIMVDSYAQAVDEEKISDRIDFSYQDKGDFEFELKFGGDVLLFLMHTNIFEIPRNHEVLKTPYIKKDLERSYCGMIQVFNFLADSFKYSRDNDAGYMIGRLMVNKEKHYFIEGKKEIGMIYHNFEQSVLNKEAIIEIIKSAIEYTVNFDLLMPPYDAVSMVSVGAIKSARQGSLIRTGKRLGFKFQSDIKEVKGFHN
ncbi:MAG: hypothetical protein B7C24_01455 [Bacteroidetes bacterium 4572_77]|nr:MAG: hypothetical protein B7C24_01455 [Bacteroidetes bacterium 4572_77]